MKSFSRSANHIGIDMGSSRTRIFSENRLLLDERTVVAVDSKTNEMVGFGTDAIIRYHSNPQRIRLEWTIRNGAMVDYYYTKGILTYFLKKVLKQALARPEIVLSISSGLSSVARHALIDAVMHAGAQKAFLLPVAVAAALGQGIRLDTPDVVLSMNIGQDVTDCGMFSCGGVIAQEQVVFGGRTINEGIQAYMRESLQIIIGMDEAESIKQDMVSVVEDGLDMTFAVHGRRVVDGVSVVMQMTSSRMYPIIQMYLEPVAELAERIIRQASPDMAEDLLKHGLLLTGGTARLSGLDKWLANRLGIPVRVPEHAEISAVMGCSRTLDEYKKIPDLIESGEKYYGRN